MDHYTEDQLTSTGYKEGARNNAQEQLKKKTFHSTPRKVNVCIRYLAWENVLMLALALLPINRKNSIGSPARLKFPFLSVWRLKRGNLLLGTNWSESF